MAVNPDFRDLFAALNAAGARYLLVGGYAVAFHAQPRFTKGLDIWTEPEAANAARVYEALRRFGAPLQELVPGDLERPGMIFQIGVPPSRIDIVTAIDGRERSVIPHAHIDIAQMTANPWLIGPIRR